MRRLLLSSVAGAGLVLFSMTAAAQDRDRDRDDDSYRSERDARFNDQHWRGRLFDDVRQDVQHVQSATWPSGGGENRLRGTIDQLNQLQAKLADHVYDESSLDQVIDSLGRVASYNRMAPRDRDILSDDV